MFRACCLAGAAASATLVARGVFLCEVFAPLAWPERRFSEQRATDGEQELAIGISLLARWMSHPGAGRRRFRLAVSGSDPRTIRFRNQSAGVQEFESICTSERSVIENSAIFHALRANQNSCLAPLSAAAGVHLDVLDRP